MKLGNNESSEKKQSWEKSQEFELKFQTQDSAYAMKVDAFPPEHIQKWTKNLREDFTNYLQVDFSIFEGADIVEIGCGCRGVINLISGPGKRIGIDPLIEEFRIHDCLLELDHVQLFKQKAERLEFSEGTFDIALSFNVLDHVEDIDLVLGQIYRVLKPNGLFLMNVHTFEMHSTTLFPWLLQRIDPTHPYHFSKKSILRSLMRAGFEIHIANIQSLNLNYRNILFRMAANLIGRTLWVKATK